MKTAISFKTINPDTSGPGAFMRAAKWYWDEVTDMVAAAGFTSIAISMVPNSPNVARNGAPICTAAINTRYGSAEGYLSYLNEKGIEDVPVMMISAQSLLDSMFESGIPMENFFDEFFRYAEDVCIMLKKLGGTDLMVSPTPAVGPLAQLLNNNEDKMAAFFSDSALCMNRIGKMSAKLGIRTCVKNDFWTMARGNLVDEFLSKTDASVVGFTPDTAQLKIAGCDYQSLIEKYAGSISSICFTDTRYEDTTENYKSISPEYPQSGPMQRCYHDLGFGTIDFPKVYKTLTDHQFDGTVVLESRYTLDVPKAILRMRTFWNRLTK